MAEPVEPQPWPGMAELAESAERAPLVHLEEALETETLQGHQGIQGIQEPQVREGQPAAQQVRQGWPVIPATQVALVSLVQQDQVANRARIAPMGILSTLQDVVFEQTIHCSDVARLTENHAVFLTKPFGGVTRVLVSFLPAPLVGKIATTTRRTAVRPICSTPQAAGLAIVFAM